MSSLQKGTKVTGGNCLRTVKNTGEPCPCAGVTGVIDQWDSKAQAYRVFYEGDIPSHLWKEEELRVVEE